MHACPRPRRKAVLRMRWGLVEPQGERKWSRGDYPVKTFAIRLLPESCLKRNAAHFADDDDVRSAHAQWRTLDFRCQKRVHYSAVCSPSNVHNVALNVALHFRSLSSTFSVHRPLIESMADIVDSVILPVEHPWMHLHHWRNKTEWLDRFLTDRIKSLLPSNRSSTDARLTGKREGMKNNRWIGRRLLISPKLQVARSVLVAHCIVRRDDWCAAVKVIRQLYPHTYCSHTLDLAMLCALLTNTFPVAGS